MKRLIVLGVVLLMFAAAPARADDLFPPSYRGLELSYTCEWDQFANFSNPQGFFPDTESSVGDGSHLLFTHWNTHIDFDGAGWVDMGGGIANPARSAEFATNVVNWIDWRPLKLLRVQVTYFDPSMLGLQPTIIGVSGISTAAPNGSLPPGDEDLMTPGVPVGGMPLPPGYFYEDWIIEPNPDWEQIAFAVPQGVIIEQIVIDTISVPGNRSKVCVIVGEE